MLRNYYAIPPGCDIIVISALRFRYRIVTTITQLLQFITQLGDNVFILFFAHFYQNIHQFDQIIHSHC